VKTLYENADKVHPLISKELYDIVCGNAEFIDGVCDYCDSRRLLRVQDARKIVFD
jgi:hypothetical protein